MLCPVEMGILNIQKEEGAERETANCRFIETAHAGSQTLFDMFSVLYCPLMVENSGKI